MKKTLVIYCSGTGNTEAMANAVLEGKQGQQTEEAAAEETASADAECSARIFLKKPNL